jgi:DNA-binding NarL/FixJ family response regulator
MKVPSEPGVLIIDALPLRSLGFISTLNRLSHLRVRDPRKAPVTLHTPDEAGPWIDAHANCEMLIYIVGGARNANCDHLERIKALRALAPDMPLMILADGESREEIISTLNSGAQGFLYVGANAELALRALSFMLNGGSYFPSATRLKHTDPAQRHPAIDCIPAPSCVMNGDNGAAKNLEDAARNRSLTARQKAVFELLSRGDTNGDSGSARNLEDAARNRSLTARQMAVLELLSRGDTNKVIARRLGMREGTVKVHVRQIMRKFGVTNRTELAVAFAKGRIAARCSPGCGDVDARIPGLGAGGNAVTLAELMT